MRDRQTITDEVETILDKPVLDQTDVAHSQKLVIELLLDIREMLREPIMASAIPPLAYDQ